MVDASEFKDVKGAVPGGTPKRPYMPVGYKGNVIVEGFKFNDGFTGKAYIMEFEVKTPRPDLGVPAGFLTSHYVAKDEKQKMHTGHILGWAHAVAAANGLEPPTDDEGPAAVAALFAGDGRSAAGIELGCITIKLQTKAGKDFTKFVWSAPFTDEELGGAPGAPVESLL